MNILPLHFSNKTTDQLPFTSTNHRNFITRLHRTYSLKKVTNRKELLSEENCELLYDPETPSSLEPFLAHGIEIADSFSSIVKHLTTNDQIYMLFIDPDKMLITSKQYPEFFLGICKNRNGNGRITGQALWRKMPINKHWIAKECFRITRNIFSLVFEQYYLQSIFKEMNTIEKKLDEIGGFQRREYQSKIATLVTECRRIDTDTLPSQKKKVTENQDTANRLLTDCAYLLNQSKAELQHHVGKFQTSVLSERDYLSAVQNMTEPVVNYTALLGIMLYIHELKCKLGTADYKDLQAIQENYFQPDILQGVEESHNTHFRRLGIDLENERIRVDGWFSTSYKALPSDIAFQIRSQLAACDAAEKLFSAVSFYSQPQRLIFKDGAVYRVINNENNNNPRKEQMYE